MRPKSAPESAAWGPFWSSPGALLGGLGRLLARSGERPEAPRAQKGSPDAKTFGFYEVFAPPSPKSDGLAEVFK